VDDHILTEIGVIDEQITHYKKHVSELEKTIQDFHDRQKTIHKDIADLAQIQDRSQIELKELRQQLESNPPSDKLKEINEKIEGVENTIRHADKSINDNFDIQDKLTDDIDGMKESIAEFNEKINDLTLQRKDMVKWAQQIKTVAYIRTKGAIYNGTFIAGINSTRVLRETMRSAQIFEARVPDAPEGWEIRIG
jgi:chromosome segregation ATPase